MSNFPQIGRGTLAQFPVRRSRKWRSIENRLESSERIALPDAPANEVQWKLSMTDLSDAEVSAIAGLFRNMNGQFGSFLFVDPMANLLGWSEDFSKPDWQPGLLTVAGGSVDPLGTNRGVVITNNAAGLQSLQQTIPLPGDYVACFSVWLSSDAPCQISLGRDGRMLSVPTTSDWKRAFLGGTGLAGAGQSTFSLTVPAGNSVKVWGLQVEAQPDPSKYRVTSSARGIYEETYFGTDELNLTSTGVGLSSCDLILRSRSS
jgi:hypothetical protein